MSNIYTLIVHLPGEQGWHDRCGDYHSGVDSELIIQYYSDLKKLAIDKADYQFKNSSYESTVLINGVNPYDFNDSLISLSNEELSNMESQIDEIEDLCSTEVNRLTQIKRQKDEDEKKRKQEETEHLRKLEIERKEAAEKQELSRLLAKYKNN